MAIPCERPCERPCELERRQDHVQNYHAQVHANYKDHPEQDVAQLQESAQLHSPPMYAQVRAQKSPLWLGYMAQE